MKANSNTFRAFLRENYPLIGILLGTLFVSVSLGPFTNWDAQLEFEAASNSLKHGFPLISTGFLINQPPLGFYLDTPFLLFFGASYTAAVNIVTAFGLGSVFLVYQIGKTLYGKRTGLVAAALFGLSPWQVFMSRTFLVDAQALFFSLLYLLVGIYAVQKKSFNMLIAAGGIFAAALLTKLFSVFMLAPLLIVLYAERKNFVLTPKRTAFFLLPTVLSQGVWYGVFANQNFLAVYFNSDFTHPLQAAAPLSLFMPQLLTQSMGWLILAAAVFSLFVSVSYKKLLANTLISDFICAATIVAVAGLDLLLVFGFKLNVPFVSSFKYLYQAAPFFCMLAASLLVKSYVLLKRHRIQGARFRLALPVAVVGLGLLLGSLVESMVFLYFNSGKEIVLFSVGSAVGYPFQQLAPGLPSGIMVLVQLVASFLIMFSLLLALVIRKVK